MKIRDLFEANTTSDIAPGTKKSKKVKLKDGRIAVLTIQHWPVGTRGDTKTVAVTVKADVDGNYAGGVIFYQNTHYTQDYEAKFQHTWTASSLNVNPDYLRQGLATEMYAFATACGMRIIPSGQGYGKGGGKLLPDGERFWARQRTWHKTKGWQVSDYWRRPKEMKR